MDSATTANYFSSYCGGASSCTADGLRETWAPSHMLDVLV